MHLGFSKLQLFDFCNPFQRLIFFGRPVSIRIPVSFMVLLCFKELSSSKRLFHVKSLLGFQRLSCIESLASVRSLTSLWCRVPASSRSQAMAQIGQVRDTYMMIDSIPTSSIPLSSTILAALYSAD